MNNFKDFYDNCLNLLGILKYEVEQSDRLSVLDSLDVLTELYSEFKGFCEDKQQIDDIKYIYKSYLKKVENLDEEGYYKKEIEKLREIL